MNKEGKKERQRLTTPPPPQTSLDKTGSDAMNAAGDYSSAYCILHTDSEFKGHGMVPPSLPSTITPS